MLGQFQAHHQFTDLRGATPWSVQRKSELVLRPLRGDTLDAVSAREPGAGPRARELEAQLPRQPDAGSRRGVEFSRLLGPKGSLAPPPGGAGSIELARTSVAATM